MHEKIQRSAKHRFGQIDMASILRTTSLFLSVAMFSSLLVHATHGADPAKIVFLGDKGHHRPADLAGRIVPVLKKRGIEIEYTEDVNVLSEERLKGFDGLLIYANIDQISKIKSERCSISLRVAKASSLSTARRFCFRNSEAYVELCGAQFKSHGGEVFDTVNVQPEHPIMKGFGGFRSWDETYVHTKHNEKDRIVLEVRRQGGQAPARQKNHGHGSERTGRDESSTRPGVTMHAPGVSSDSTICSNAASSGRSVAILRLQVSSFQRQRRRRAFCGT